MPKTWARSALLMVLLTGSLLGGAAPAQAVNTQIDGSAVLETSPGVTCEKQAAPYDVYPVLVVRGSLTGCWYTNVLSAKTTPSGMYLETGTELFIGTLDGRASGTFTTTYRFEAKFAADGSEVRGRCQHPLVAGSGTGVFAGATGRLNFKDIIGVPVTYVYRGHIRFR